MDILTWYNAEDRKREKKLMNEIDLNEIEAAKRGTVNIWYKYVKSEPEIFKGDKRGEFPISWDKMLEGRDMYHFNKIVYSR